MFGKILCAALFSAVLLYIGACYEWARRVSKDKIERTGVAKGNSALEDELYKTVFREGRIPLSPKGKELYLRYKKMLEDCLKN